jgi:hypothetical protein
VLDRWQVVHHPSWFACRHELTRQQRRPCASQSGRPFARETLKLICILLHLSGLKVLLALG